MTKLINHLIMLLFCMTLNAQSTPTHSSYPYSLPLGKEHYSLKNDSVLNSKYNDYSSVVFGNGILFTSDRRESETMNSADANFYFISFDANSILKSPVLYNSDINSAYQEGMPAISPDGKTMVFSREIDKAQNSNGYSDVRLYSSTLENGVWGKVEKMSINVKGISSGHPAFSPDGDKLYFVSNRKGGYGGMDIYVSEFKKGKWKKPKNIGPKVNTPKNELFPFVDKNGVLYFSAIQKDGFGLLDIYQSVINEKGEWQSPLNMGEPFNTEANDFGLFIMEDLSSGYFSSNREGGLGENDIYSWSILDNKVTEKEIAVTKLSGVVSDEFIEHTKVSTMDETDTASEWYTDDNVTVENDLASENLNLLTIQHQDYENVLFQAKNDDKQLMTKGIYKDDCIKVLGYITDEKDNRLSLPNVRILLSNLEKDEEVETNTNENGSFEFCLSCNSNFSISAFPKDYFSEEIYITTENLDCNTYEPITSKIKISPVDHGELTYFHSNMNSLDTMPPPESEFVDRKTRNQTFLERISLADETTILPESDSNLVSKSPKINSDSLLKSADSVPLIEKENSETASETSNPDSGIKRTEYNESISLPAIFHEFNSFQINEDDKNYLNDLAAYLNNNPSLKLNINSYTDPKGKKAYNKWLSKRRAEMVLFYLVKNGVAESRLNAVGKGELTEDIENDEEIISDHAMLRKTAFEVVKSFPKDNLNEATLSNINEIDDLVTTSIYYGFDDYNLNQEAKDELQRVLNDLKENANLKLEIRSHTDSRGSDSYNQKLSQKRAEEIVSFLEANGIEKSKLQAKGYGETMLRNGCSDGVQCTKEEHAMNRRTDFIYRQMLD